MFRIYVVVQVMPLHCFREGVVEWDELIYVGKNPFHYLSNGFADWRRQIS